MAGYGTTLEAPNQLDHLMRALMHAAQRRARSLGLRMSYRYHHGVPLSEWDLSIDGNGYLIAAWSQWLDRDLPVVAEGYTGEGAGRQARNAAVSLVSRWTAWCVGDEENTTVSITGHDRGRWYWPVIDVPEPPSPLEARLRISDDIVARWLAGQVPEEIAIEELHTAVEGVVRALLGVGKGPTWPELLRRARVARTLSASDDAVLGSFNLLYRNRLKHQSAALTDVERTAAKGVMNSVLDLTERLLGNL